jgi:acetyl-CoA synthetase
VGEIDLADLLRGASPRCEPTIVDSDHPFFILPPTGRTTIRAGRAGVVQSRWYAVGAAYTTRITYDLKDEDVYCPLGDADWFAAHPAALLGPLLNGATIVLHEGIPDSGTVWRTVARLASRSCSPPSPTLRLLLGEGTPPAAKPTALRLLICDGPPLDTAGWWRAYRDILRGQGQLCANWWEPAMGAPTIGTLPSMDAKPGWLGKPLPGIGATVVDREGREVGPLVPGWLHLDGISPQRAQRDESAVRAPAGDGHARRGRLHHAPGGVVSECRVTSETCRVGAAHFVFRRSYFVLALTTRSHARGDTGSAPGRRGRR